MSQTARAIRCPCGQRMAITPKAEHAGKRIEVKCGACGQRLRVRLPEATTTTTLQDKIREALRGVLP